MPSFIISLGNQTEQEMIEWMDQLSTRKQSLPERSDNEETGL